MKTLLKTDIPSYIINSKLVEQFEDNIVIPDEYIPNNKISITNEETFKKIMNVLRFFMVEKLPKEIYDYVLANKDVNIDDFKDFFHDELVVLKTYVKRALFNGAAQIGSVNLLWYLDNYLEIEKDEWCGNQWCKDNNSPCERHCWFHGSSVIWDASCRGTKNSKKYIECMKYLHENNYAWPEDDQVDQGFYSYYSNITRDCAYCGHLDRLKFLHENGCSWTEEVTYQAASGGHLNCLKYIIDQDVEWSEYTCVEAIKSGKYHNGDFEEHPKDIPGSFECLKYAIDNGCKYELYEGHSALFEWSAKCNRLDCLEYLHNRFVKDIKKVINDDEIEYNYSWGHTAWYDNMIIWAAENAAYDCLKFLFENGYPYDDKVYYKISEIDIDGYYDKNIEDKKRRIKLCLDFIKDNMNPVEKWDNSAMELAARKGNLLQINYLFENNAPCPNNIIDNAAKSGDIEIIKIFEKKGYKKYATTDACANTAKYLKMDCLKYLHENGYSWDDEVVYNIAVHEFYFHNDKEKHRQEIIKHLKYPLENGCPWGKAYGESFDSGYHDNIWHTLVSDRNLTIFKFLHSQIKTSNYTMKHNDNCFWTQKIIKDCLWNCCAPILHFMCENPCICHAGIKHTGDCGKIPWPQGRERYRALSSANINTLKLAYTYGCEFDVQKMLEETIRANEEGHVFFKQVTETMVKGEKNETTIEFLEKVLAAESSSGS